MRFLNVRHAAPLAGSILCYFATGVTPTFAQSDSGGLEQIVVTARKQVENILNVPVAVSALTAEALETRGITDLGGVSDFTPGFKLDSVAQSRNDRANQTLIIRGMTPNYNGNVSVFIDGTPVTAFGFVEGLQDLQRVEIVKGPQSSTFGRATFAGAVNLVTRDPSPNEYHASIDASVTTYGGHDLWATGEGPLIQDKLALRVQARDYSTDGTYTNTANNGHIGAQKTDAINATIKATPTDALSIKLFGDYWTDHDGTGATYKIYSNQYNCAAGAAGATLNYTCGQLPKVNLANIGANDVVDAAVNNVILHNSTHTMINMPGMSSDFTNHFGLERHAYHLNGVIGYDIPSIDATFTSTTSYDSDKFEELQDIDNENSAGMPNPLYSAAAYGTLQSFINWPAFAQFVLNGYSQDVRLQGGASGRFHWSLGGSYVHQNYGFGVGALLSFGPTMFQTPTNTKTETTGGFFSVGYDITSQITVSFDGRYENEKQTVYDLTSGSPVAQASESFNNFLPRALIQYHPVKDVMIYASFSEGVNPGGFNTNLIGYAPATTAQIASTYDINLLVTPEKLKNYELGLKGQFLDGRAQIITDVYHAIWTNQIVENDVTVQGISGVPAGTILDISQNIGQTDLTGFEIEGTIVPTKGLTINGGFAYTPSTIKKYNCTICAIDITGSTNVNGHHLGGVPAVTADAGVEYRQPLTTSIDGYFRVDWAYQGRIYEDETNLAWTPAASKVNLRIGVERGNLTVEGYVTNLFNDLTYGDIQRNEDLLRGFGNVVIAGLPPQRMFGLRLRAKI